VAVCDAVHFPPMLKLWAEYVILSNPVPGPLLGLILAILAPGAVLAQQCKGPVAPFLVQDGGIQAPLCGLIGDVGRGRALVAGRQGNCLACHAAPIPEQAFHGDIGPPLHGVARRRSAAELRLQVVDAGQLNARTVMPPFHRVAGLTGVRPDRIGHPLLTAAEVEDVIAYLLTLDGKPARQ